MFDRRRLCAALVVCLRERGLSANVAAKEIGISPSTMSRLIRGYLPDVETFAHLIRWLGADANQYLNAPVTHKEPVDAWATFYTTLQELDMSMEFIEALAVVIRAMHRGLYGTL